MKADYDSQADTIQIELKAVDRLDCGKDDVEGIVVGFLDDRPAMVDIIGTRQGVERPLRAAAVRYDLDAEALIAAAQAALAAPDRPVTLEVAARVVA